MPVSPVGPSWFLKLGSVKFLASLWSVSFAIILGIGVVLGLVVPGSFLGVAALAVVAAISVPMFKRCWRADPSDSPPEAGFR